MISYFGYEPDPTEAGVARQRAAGTSIHIMTRGEFAALDGHADVVVSFSVLEHVRDRPAYLRSCQRVLKPGGTVFLSYDDGHFRSRVENDRVESVLVALRAGIRQLGSRFRRPASYQRAVAANVLASEIAAAGLRVDKVRYENLGDFKQLAKVNPSDRRANFVAFWIEVEDRLNASFASDGPPFRGDRAGLWQACLTRTLELKHVNEPHPFTPSAAR